MLKSPIHIIALLMLCTLFSCQEGYLAEKGWNRKVEKEINGMIREYGSGSKGYDSLQKPYAVFDFDNTTIINDIEMTLLVHQINRMAFEIHPEEMFSLLTDCLDDLDKPLGLEGSEQVTARMLATDIAADYRAIRALPEETDLSGTDAFLDFRAKMRALYTGVENTYDYAAACLWIINLFKGMTPEEVKALTRESVDHWLSFGGMKEWTWTSPDRGEAGCIRARFHVGLALTDEMKELYKVLSDNGFDVYVCSASMEDIVETMACDPAYGLGLPEDHVFGLRLMKDTAGRFLPAYDPSYIQTFKEGKVKAIRSYMAPAQGGADPLLVAGDSNGDYAMLTAFDGMKVGLIIDAGAGKPLSDLSMQAKDRSSRYCLQARNAPEGVLVP